ncbi:MAG: hypothetical protein R3321_10205 [Nitrososphaeraceae archaeon]|nr:hypothetical protein [Nitrososphaeraceae archaeon]
MNKQFKNGIKQTIKVLVYLKDNLTTRYVLDLEDIEAISKNTGIYQDIVILILKYLNEAKYIKLDLEPVKKPNLDDYYKDLADKEYQSNEIPKTPVNIPRPEWIGEGNFASINAIREPTNEDFINLVDTLAIQLDSFDKFIEKTLNRELSLDLKNLRRIATASNYHKDSRYLAACLYVMLEDNRDDGK